MEAAAQEQFKTRYFRVEPNLVLAADTGGVPNAPPVIFLHGTGQSRRAWQATARAAAAAGFRAIVLDLRGHGESGWAQDGDYTMEAHVRDLVAVIAEIGDRPALVGASLGGNVALAAAADLGPDHVSAVVLVDVAPRVNLSGTDRIKTFMRACAAGFVDVEAAADAIAAYTQRPRRANLDGLRRLLRQGDNGRLYWDWDPRVAGDAHIDPEGDEPRLEAAARAAKVPIFLVRGALSPVVTDEMVHHFQTLAPSAEVFSVPDAGHGVSGDSNDAFTGAILDFLKRTRAR